MDTALARNQPGRGGALRSAATNWQALPAPSLADIEGASGLIASIYDTTLDPSLWPEVLASCRDFVGGYAASLFCKDTSGLAGGIFFQCGRISPEYGQLYFERYSRLDPATGAHVMAPLERPISSGDVIDPSELYDTRFYREWAEPQGLIDFVSASIEKRGDWAAMFGVFRHQRDGVANAETKVRMSLLVPHIRRAFLIGKVIEQRSFEAASLGDAFDGLAAGMFVIDAAGVLVHANAAGHELLRRGGPLELKDDRIVAANRDDAGPLNAIVAAGGGSAAVRDANGDSFAAHLLPLTSGARRTTGVRYSAVAALFVHCVDIDLPAAPEIIARTYSLTLSELRVLLAIVEVGGVPETAQALGVAETTVKTHLHHVFTKTGMSRQADLVRMVAGFAGPLARKN